LEQGLKIVKIFKEHSSKTCILDDFSFYEVRQKTILEKKAKQTQKQVRTRKQFQKSFSFSIYITWVFLMY